MKVNNNFPSYPTRKTAPPIIFVGRPIVDAVPIVASYFVGSLSGILLMDYLMYLSMISRVQHSCCNGVVERF